MRRWMLLAAGAAVLGGWVLGAGPKESSVGAQRAPGDAVSLVQAMAPLDRAPEPLGAGAQPTASGASAPTAGPRSHPLAGLDLARIGVDDDGVTVRAGDGRVARLTLDAELQRTATAMLSAHRLPHAAIVMMDVASGELLVYASRADEGPVRDLCAEASAPAASIFKIVTGAALVEHAGLRPGTRQCYYSGGEHAIRPGDLVEDARRDRACTTLGGAMGRSINTVFARLAQKHLTPAVLERTARAFGFGEPVPFDAPVKPSTLTLPADPLGFARTAAGFWNTTLSPLEAAWMSATIARGGEALRPMIVREVIGADHGLLYTGQRGTPIRRMTRNDVAQALTTMMEQTVSEGTSFRAFHDPKGTPLLPGIGIAGKTGTLSDHDHLYTWFTGFAPSRPLPGVRPVAVAVLVINKLTWHVKANIVARNMLRAYFAQKKMGTVVGPPAGVIALRGEPPSRAPR